MYRKPADAAMVGSVLRTSRVEALESRIVFAAPTFATIPNGLVVLAPAATHAAGAPLHIALDGFDADGQALTYSVTSDNPDLLWEIPAGNSAMKITVSYTDAQGVARTGDMIFQLFDDLAPNTTAQIKQLVADGFYDGIIFHRIIQNFMIQGGDPTGTGTGGSPLGEFDDEYHPDLQFTSSGILAMAKSNDDTNNSQFFITAGPTRHLDFNHSIFGFLVEGDDVRAAVAAVPTGSNDRPINNVTMTSVTLIDDPQNAVLRLKAKPGTTGTANVTVTATDPDGNQYSQTFQVTIQADANNNNPFLAPLPETITITQGDEFLLTLQAYDPENNLVEFQVAATGTGLEFDVPSNSITAQPQNGVGSLDVIIMTANATPGAKEIRFYVRPAGSGSTADSVIDAQFVTVVVLPKSPTGVTLDPSSDTGSSASDGYTSNSTELKFRVAGVQVGNTVQLMLGDQVVGQAAATANNVNDGVIEITTNPGFTFAPGQHSVTAIQKGGGVDSLHSSAFTLTIDQLAPTFLSSPPTAPILAGLEKSNLYNAQTDEEDTTGVLYELITKPSGMTIHATSGVISWLPQSNQAGSHQVIIRATDKAGNFSDQTFEVVVQANSAPVITPIGDQGINENQPLTVTVIADDPDLALGDSLTYALVGNVPEGASIQPATGVFTWVPSELQGGQTYSITVRVTDSFGSSDEATFQVVVASVDEPPVLAPIGDQVVNAGETLQLQLSATDPDLPAQALIFSLESGAPDGMTLDAQTGLLEWTPGPSIDFAEYQVTVRVTDETGLFDTKTFTVLVVSEPEFVPIADQTVAEKSTLSFVVQATSPVIPPPVLTYSLVDPPANAVINAQTGVFAFTPSEAQGPGQFEFSVKVTDSYGLSATTTFVVTVTEVNEAPILAAIADQKVERGIAFELQIVATDPDLPANLLTYSLEPGAPEGMTINPESGLLQWHLPANQAVGDNAITVRVTDEGGLSHTRTFTLSVIAPPTIGEIDNYVIDEHSTLTVAVVAQSEVTPTPSFTFSLIDPPPGATIDPATGVFSWTPNEVQGPGEFTINVQVVDSNGLSAAASFNVVVEEVNAPPVLAAIAPQTVAVGNLLQLTVVASDPDWPANLLEFRLLEGAPEGMTIHPTTGEVAWEVPGDIAAGTYIVTVEVRDTDGLTDSQSFLVTLQTKPVIEPIAVQSVREFESLAVQISASSAVVPTPALSYSLGPGAPAGSQIDSVTGLFTWTPGEEHGGASYEITVNVIDSNGLSETAVFSINVQEVNQPPVLAEVPQVRAIPGQELVVQLHATDPDLPANTVTFSIISGPESATVDPVTGIFRWTPNGSQVGSRVNVVVRVSDSGDPSLSAEVGFEIVLGDPNVGAIPGGGPGLPSSVETSSANATLISRDTLNRLSNAFDNAGNIDLVGSAGSQAVIQGYEDDANSGAPPMIGVVSDFQIGPDTGVGSQITPPQKQRVRRPQTENEPGDNDTNEESTQNSSGRSERSVKGRQQQRRDTVQSADETKKQTTSNGMHDEIDAAVGSLPLSAGDIAVHQILTRQETKGLQVYSQPVTAANSSTNLAALPSSGHELSLPSVPVRSENPAEARSRKTTSVTLAATATTAAVFMPLLVSELDANDQGDGRKRRWWQKRS